MTLLRGMECSQILPDHTTRPLRVPVLRQELCQAPGRRYLELPILPQDHRRRSLHRLVSPHNTITRYLSLPEYTEHAPWRFAKEQG